MLSNNLLLTVGFVLALPVVAEAQKSTKNLLSSNGAENTPVECTTVMDNVVVNCGFETGDLSGWQFFGVDPAHNFVAAFARHSGNFGLAMGSVGDFGCFDQRVATNPGQVYVLSFWLANSGRPNSFQVYWGGGEFPVQISGDMNNMPDFDYTKYTLPGLVGSGSDLLVFCARNDPSYFYLDDVVVH